jgi:c-di-GMP-related signal transduction protein
VRLLGEDEVDTQRVSEVLATDPAMVVRVLRLVNSSAEGLSHRVDSLQQAIVLLGATRVSGLVMASLVSSTARSMDNLWLMLARAAACRELAESESAYTLGLLSALSWESGIPFRVLVEQTRVSPELATALMLGTGRLGRVLTAVVAHEQNDQAALFATGIDPERVALASLVAIPWALSTVLTAVSAPR